jgi:hypothetical protein
MTPTEVRMCPHGKVITYKLALRARDCDACSTAHRLAEAKRCLNWRKSLNDEAKEALAEYDRQYRKQHRASLNAKLRLRRATRRLIAALDAKADAKVIQKRRYELAVALQLIFVYGAW